MSSGNENFSVKTYVESARLLMLLRIKTRNKLTLIIVVVMVLVRIDH